MRWTVHKCGSTRFPFRVAIERDGRTLLAVRATSPWPGPGQQVFCLREDGSDPDDVLELIEEAPVLQYSPIGRKLAVVLDRPLRKRCEFLFVAKPYKDRPGSYEQVFFRTEAGIRSHRSRSRLEVQPRDVEIAVVIDSGEKYPWSFPGATLSRRKLAVGDYALMDSERMVAVVERKSYDNLLADLGSMQALHHALAHLAACDRAAMVVEAQYGDFIDERRLNGRWPAVYVARALAELTVMHPQLNVVFAGSRKLANQWTYRFFLACATHEVAPQLEFVRETAPGYDGAWERPVGLDEQVRVAVIAATEPFTVKELASRVTGANDMRVRRVLKEMEREGKTRLSGRGRAARWTRLARMD